MPTRFLFRDPLKREELSGPPDPELPVLRIAVHRNHAFEPAASVLNAFLGLSGVRAEFLFGGYDDSLSFADLPEDADLHLIWFDAARCAGPDILSLLVFRIRDLQSRVACPRVAAACLGMRGAAFPALADVDFLDCDETLASLGDAAFDARLEPYSGTRLSNSACLFLARELGLRRIPALLFPALKAVAVDLDNTLHDGVLGEDGIRAVKPRHEVQRALAELARRGILLALVSKNEEEDARALFAERDDYPLRWEDFAAHAVSWEPKAEGVAAVAAELNIGADAVLFVDDNPGERFDVARNLPEVRILEADTADDIAAGLRWYPGLWKRSLEPEDFLRGADLRAEAGRKFLRRHMSREEYLRELEVTVRIAVNPAERGGRIHELLHKTNQFILAYKRPERSEVDAWLGTPGRCVVAASLSDRLSDGGLIAVALARKEEQDLRLDELVVSCRALGRGIEAGMIAAMLRRAGEFLQAGPGVFLPRREGPRNRPALDWLAGLPGAAESSSEWVRLESAPPADLAGVRLLFED